MHISKYSIFCGLLLLSGAAVFSGDAADESVRARRVAFQRELPGESIPSARPPAGRELPSESLPALGGGGAPELPSESLAATTLQPPEAGGAEGAGGEEEGMDLDDRPWLRLESEGHSDVVRALAFSADSQRLYSAGNDKETHVWSRGVRGSWAHERTIRWQIQRGNRGHIHALAAGGDLLAVGGYGAMGYLGEIVLFDPRTGELKQALADEASGHNQVISGLSFSGGDSPVLASHDVRGRVIVWKRGEGGALAPQAIMRRDEAEYPDIAARLQPYRRRGPVVMAGPAHVVFPAAPEFVRPRGAPRELCAWRLWRRNIETGANVELTAETPHYDMVTALAASGDGRKLVSADGAGGIFFWSLAGTSAAGVVERGRGSVIALAMSEDGRLTLAGKGASDSTDGKGVIQLWNTADISTPKLIREFFVDRNVEAVALSRDGATFAYAQGALVITGKTGDFDADPQTLDSKMKPVLRVAFANDADDPYRIAVGRRRGRDGTVPFEQVFDLGDVQLSRAARIDQRAWMFSDWWSGDWKLNTFQQEGGETYWLYEGREPRCRLPLRPEIHGKPTSWCWLPAVGKAPPAVVVGTDGENHLYIFKLSNEKANGWQAETLRVYRGHASEVTSVGVSRDFRYLVSGSLDSTVRVWKLDWRTDDFSSDAVMLSRWGAEMAIEDDQLVVTAVREDGPLYFKGLRVGDVLTSMDWKQGGEDQHAEEPAKMVDACLGAPWETLCFMHSTRARAELAPFQCLPAWQPVATLVIDNNREWAFWTPAGYYDASFNGHKLFGWQVNRGLDKAPDFFLAAQLRKTLEKPEVMKRLLKTGSVEEAFRAARLAPPVDSQSVLGEQYALKPDVQILSPSPEKALAGDSVTVEAAVTVRYDQSISAVKAFAGGVVAEGGDVISDERQGDRRRIVYRWRAQLPSDRRILLQVVAATSSETAGSQSIAFDHALPAKTRRGRMFVFSAGVGDYRDAAIVKLDSPQVSTPAFTAVMRRQSQPLYDPRAFSLLDRDVTRSMWRIAARQYADMLREDASPDDLLVVFLSGHGVQDKATGQYYFISADAKYADVLSRRYGDCIAAEDFAVFADIPCRKLVILDTCHSGAVQDVSQQQLKAAVRALQDDLVLTLTASEGGQEALDGRFGARLIEGLQGLADRREYGGDGDGRVTLSELVAYVRSRVSADAAGSDISQHPVAAPAELLEYVELPLTAVSAR